MTTGTPGHADANAMAGTLMTSLREPAGETGHAPRDRSDGEGTMTTQDWRIYLARSAPPGAILDFSAAEFALEVAINLRYCLNLVRPTPECIDLAEFVLLRAADYGKARTDDRSHLFAEAENALAQATRLLEIELDYCSRREMKQDCDQAA